LRRSSTTSCTEKASLTPPLASAEKPFSVVEEREYYVFEFRKPFGPSGGGYVKTFHVHRATGKVSRGAWQLGR